MSIIIFKDILLVVVVVVFILSILYFLVMRVNSGLLISMSNFILVLGVRFGWFGCNCRVWGRYWIRIFTCYLLGFFGFFICLFDLVYIGINFDVLICRVYFKGLILIGCESICDRLDLCWGLFGFGIVDFVAYLADVVVVKIIDGFFNEFGGIDVIGGGFSFGYFKFYS